MNDSVVVAFTTFPDMASARQIGTELVKRQCAACVNLLPGVESIYHWDGKLCQEPEIMAVVKSTAGRVEALKAAVKELSGYACPELIVLPVTDGLPAYLDWVRGGGDGR